MFCFNISHRQSLGKVFIWTGAKLSSPLCYPLHTVVPFTTWESSLVTTVVKQDCPSCWTKWGEIGKSYFFPNRKKKYSVPGYRFSFFPSLSVLSVYFAARLWCCLNTKWCNSSKSINPYLQSYVFIVHSQLFLFLFYSPCKFPKSRHSNRSCLHPSIS